MTAVTIAVILAFGAAMLGIGMAALALAVQGRSQRPAQTEYVERYERRVTTPNAIAIRDGGVSTQQFEPWESEPQRPIIIMLPAPGASIPSNYTDTTSNCTDLGVWRNP
jgi:hypothetical protein